MAFLFIKQPQNPNVHYHGKVLPADTAAPAQPLVDPTVHYHGKQLPRDEVLPNLAPPDLSNNPSLIIINGITLPPDTLLLFDGEKILAEAMILDGVPIIEHIAREAHKIELEGVFRYTPDQGTSYIFPQDVVDNYFTNVFLPNSVQQITNTFLNKLGVLQVIVKRASLITVRASKNVPFKLHLIENVIGQSLIVPPS